MKNIFVNREVRAVADLVPLEGGMLITRINVPQQARGHGYGSKLLLEILEEADKTQTVLFLQISPSGGLTYGQLRAWYQRHGFKHHISPTLGELWMRSPKRLQMLLA